MVSGHERAPDSGLIDVAILEDVWGARFADLATRYHVVRIEAADAATRAAVSAVAGRAMCIVIRNRTIVDRDLLVAAPRLRVIARAGTGLDNIDLEAASDLGVVVVAAIGANAQSVAEMAIGLALGLARRIPSLDRGIRIGEWDRRPGVELAGRTWGVLGLGRTGIETARLARALGMTVIGYDPFVGRDAPHVREIGVQVRSLEDVRAHANVLSLHMPLTKDTLGMVDHRFLSAMLPSAFLINVARGEIVEEEALQWALSTGVIAGAALDVRTSEPAVPGPLDVLDNVILTPHVAGLTGAAADRIAEVLSADLARLLTGEDALDAVGPIRRIRQ